MMDLQRAQSLISHMSRGYAELYDRTLGYLKGLYALGENRLTVEVLPPEVLARYLDQVGHMLGPHEQLRHGLGDKGSYYSNEVVLAFVDDAICVSRYPLWDLMTT